MRYRHSLLMAGSLVAATLSGGSATAADPPAAVAAAPGDAAVIYWQAFAALPKLPEPDKAAYDAAATSVAGPIDAGVGPIVARFDGALRELHRACGAAECDWALDYEAGPNLGLPHLQSARELAKAALLRARLRLAAGDPDGAVSDVVDVFRLARDCGRSPLLVSLLVRLDIESRAIDTLAGSLPHLTPGRLEHVSSALAALPAPPTVADCVRFEGRMYGDWAERIVDAEVARTADPRAGAKVFAAIVAALAPDGTIGGESPTPPLDLSVAELRESLRSWRQDSARMAEIADLPPARRDGRWAEVEGKAAAEKDPMRVFSGLFLPVVSKISRKDDRHRTRRALLLAAIRVQREGADSIRGTTVPGHGPVEYRTTDGGFELRCQEGPDGEAEVLRIGASG